MRRDNVALCLHDMQGSATDKVFAYFNNDTGGHAPRDAMRCDYGKRSLVQSHGVPMLAHLALTPAIDDFRRQFEQLADDADALVATLSDEQFAWQPAPNAWS